MNRDEFVEMYTSIVQRALNCSEKARREGLLALEEELDAEKADERDIFEYGLRFVIDGTDKKTIEKILSNIVKQEKDESMYILKTIQKEAVLAIQDGIIHPRLLYCLLNSYTDIPIKEDKIRNILKI
jgi:flagellar motor component MotA